MLKTARLTLVPHDPTHFEVYAAMWAKEPGHFLRSMAPMRPEDAWSRLLRFAGHWATLGYGLFLGFDSSGRLVGEAGFADFHRGLGSRFDGVPEGMWKIETDVQGHGFASEAMAAISVWLDETHDLPRTVAMIDPGNAASIRVATKLGFIEMERTVYRDAPILLLERLSRKRP